ncbi:hypothetical protein [Nannocystis pusilla]|uniref:hypothetical protein n=1 Tax=Nannocystis pusilla TaxID=889268 RepID=UPI003DA2FF1E
MTSIFLIRIDRRAQKNAGVREIAPPAAPEKPAVTISPETIPGPMTRAAPDPPAPAARAPEISQISHRYARTLQDRRRLCYRCSGRRR